MTVQARSGARRRAATRDDVLAATKRLLAQGAPLASLSVERIVVEAGVVRTTFYLHFRDKYELIEALAAEQETWIEGIGQGALRGVDLSRDAILEAVQEIVAGWSANHAVLAAIIELAEYDERMRTTWRSMMHSIAVVAATGFARQWTKENVEPESPAMVAEVLTWMIERSCHVIAGDPTQCNDVAVALAEVIWRVLAGGPTG